MSEMKDKFSASGKDFFDYDDPSNSKSYAWQVSIHGGYLSADLYLNGWDSNFNLDLFTSDAASDDILKFMAGLDKIEETCRTLRANLVKAMMEFNSEER